MRLLVLLAFVSSRCWPCGAGVLNAQDVVPEYYRWEVRDPGLPREAFRIPHRLRYFGAGSSNYQVEGAWNVSGKAESSLDHYFHQHPEMANADRTIDSYHKYKDDIRMLKLMNLNTYRFSFSWSRLLPTADPEKPNIDGINYYNSILNELESNHITPLVTLFHYDYPQILEDKFGGWQSREMVDYYEKYVRFAFQTFGNRVKLWASINEPHLFCTMCYGEAVVPPAKLSPGEGEYKCIHHQILAHAAAYHVLHDEFPSQQGMITMSMSSSFAMPRQNTRDDLEAAERWNVFELALVLDALIYGHYPEMVERVVGQNSANEKLPKSRLPEFSPEEVARINGTLDFISFNVYHGSYARKREDFSDVKIPSVEYDTAVEAVAGISDSRAAVSLESHIHPWSIRNVLLWLRARYGDRKYFVTENGYGDTNETSLYDPTRILYMNLYLGQLMRTINVDKVNVFGYCVWSLLDSFEWQDYDHKGGLVHVDMSSPELTRSLKDSGHFIKTVLEDRYVPMPPAPTPYQRSSSAPLGVVHWGVLGLGALLLWGRT